MPAPTLSTPFMLQISYRSVEKNRDILRKLRPRSRHERENWLAIVYFPRRKLDSILQTFFSTTASKLENTQLLFTAKQEPRLLCEDIALTFYGREGRPGLSGPRSGRSTACTGCESTAWWRVRSRWRGILGTWRPPGWVPAAKPRPWAPSSSRQSSLAAASLPPTTLLVLTRGRSLTGERVESNLPGRGRQVFRVRRA